MSSLRMAGWALSFLCVLCAAPSRPFPFNYHASRLDGISENASDNVECFLDYMELWFPKRQIEGLLLWLSQTMRFPVSLSSLDRSNHLLSRCRYFLNSDPEGNCLFRVHYSGCKVQMENGFHVLEIHIVKKTATGNGQSDRYSMRCPALTSALGRETVRCEPHFVQVSRPMPLGNSSDPEQWFLTFRGELVVSVEDASLLGIEVEMSDFSVTVRGQRGQLLNAIEFMDRQADLLPLWVARGFYAYSLEASCPLVTRHPGEEVTLSLPKQRVGLVKRGSYSTETLTLRNIVVGQSVSATVTQNKYFVVINIPSKEVLQTQECRTNVGNVPGVQVFYSVALVLDFVEMAYPMNWTMENYYECTVASSQSAHQEITQRAAFPVAPSPLLLAGDPSDNGTDNDQEMGYSTDNEATLRHMTPSSSLLSQSGYTSHNTTAKVNGEIIRETELLIPANPPKPSMKPQITAHPHSETFEENMSGPGGYSDIEIHSDRHPIEVSSIKSTVFRAIEDNPTLGTYSSLAPTVFSLLTTDQPESSNVYQSESSQPIEKHVKGSGPGIVLSKSGVTNDVITNVQKLPRESMAPSPPLKISTQPNVTPNQSTRDSHTMAFPPTTNISEHTLSDRNNKSHWSHLDSTSSDPVLMSVLSQRPSDNMAALDVESDLLAAMSGDGYIPFVAKDLLPNKKQKEQQVTMNTVNLAQDETRKSDRLRVKSTMGNPGSSSKQSESRSSGQKYRNTETNMAPFLWTTRPHLSEGPMEEIIDSPPDELETIAASEHLVLSHT